MTGKESDREIRRQAAKLQDAELYHLINVLSLEMHCRIAGKGHQPKSKAKAIRINTPNPQAGRRP